MQENFESKNKAVNKIIVCMAIYLFIAVMAIIDWRGFFPVPSPMRYEGYGALYANISPITILAKSILMIVIFYLFMNIRATENTKKLYKAAFWILIAVNIFSFLIPAAYTVIFNFFPKYISQASFNIALISNISRIYAFIAMALPVPFYIAILVKEHLDYNWMIIGSLTSTFVYFSGAAAYRMLTILKPEMVYGTQSPSSFVTGISVMNNIRGYFWLIGAIALVAIFKKRNKEYKSKNAQ